MREIWDKYYDEANGIVFVIDCADRERMNEVKIEILKILKNKDLMYAPLLILGNKQDLTNAICDIKLLTNMLDINNNDNKNNQRSIKLLLTECKNRKGIDDALSWIVHTIPNATQRIQFIQKNKPK